PVGTFLNEMWQGCPSTTWSISRYMGRSPETNEPTCICAVARAGARREESATAARAIPGYDFIEGASVPFGGSNRGGLRSRPVQGVGARRGRLFRDPGSAADSRKFQPQPVQRLRDRVEEKWNGGARGPSAAPVLTAASVRSGRGSAT